MNNDYQTYLKDQITRAESKWGRKSFYNEPFKKNLAQSWKQVKDTVGTPETICCMGIRAGTEVFEFKEYCPTAEVYGVDITENVKTIKTHLNVHISLQDFNHLPEDWSNKFDLVFSNSLDHSFEVLETIKEWRRVTKAGGFLFLELSTTPANNIEHSFDPQDIDKLFYYPMFEIYRLWETPERNIFTVLLKAVKR